MEEKAICYGLSDWGQKIGLAALKIAITDVDVVLRAGFDLASIWGILRIVVAPLLDSELCDNLIWKSHL